MGVTCALGQDHVPLDCAPHIYSSQVAPGGLGKCLLHKQHRDHSPPPRGMPCPALPHSSSLTHSRRAATPGWAPLAVLWRFTECPLLQVPPSLARIHAMGPVPMACTIWLVPSGLGPNTSSRASFLGFLRLAPPSSAWRWSFPSIQGRATLLRIITPRGSCAACQAHRSLSTSLLSWLWASPAPSCPGAPHLCCPCLDHFPHTCCYHGSSLGDRKALSASRPDWAGPEKSQGFNGQGQEGPAGGAAGQGTGQF